MSLSTPAVLAAVGYGWLVPVRPLAMFVYAYQDFSPSSAVSDLWRLMVISYGRARV